MENRNWFVHAEWVVVFVTLMGGFYTIDNKIESQIHSIREEILAQSQRTDKLYEMFIDLVKETKKG